MVFSMVFGPKTIGTNGFFNGFWSKNHWYQWFFNGFVVRQPLDTMVFQWFPMVANHWSDDGMVTIHRSGLVGTLVQRAASWAKSAFLKNEKIQRAWLVTLPVESCQLPPLGVCPGQPTLPA